MKQKFLLRLKEVCEMLGISRSTIYHYIKSHGFPKPIKLGSSPTSPSAWDKQEIDNWIEERKKERTNRK